MREVMEQLRSSGIDTGGPAPYAVQDGKAFAGQLDRFLARHASTVRPAEACHPQERKRGRRR